MLTTVTLNASLDKTYLIDNFQVDRINVVREMITAPGGKGINVARVAHQLGHPVAATGFLAGYNGRQIEAALANEGIEHTFVFVPGESRVCLNISDPTRRTQTEVRETGPRAEPTHAQALRERVRHLAERSGVVVISGSLLPGMYPEFYRELITDLQGTGAKVMFDSSGEPLWAGLKAVPFMVKPNIDELLTLLKHLRLGTAQDHQALTEWASSEEDGVMRAEAFALIVQAARALLEQGIQMVVISIGGRGAVLAIREGVWRALPLSVPVVNTVSCGDAMVAGCAVALDRGASPIEAVRWGVAAGASAATQVGTGVVVPQDVERWARQVQLVPIE